MVKFIQRKMFSCWIPWKFFISWKNSDIIGKWIWIIFSFLLTSQKYHVPCQSGQVVNYNLKKKNWKT